MVNANSQPRPRISADVTDAVLGFGLMILGLFDLLGRPWLFGGGGPGGRGSMHAPPPLAQAFFPQHQATPLSYVLVVFAFAPLTVRRRLPLTVLCVVTAAAALYQAFPSPPSLIVLAPLIAIYTVGAERSRKTLLIAGALTAAVLFASTLVTGGAPTFWADLVRIVAMVGVAGAIGDATRNQRAYLSAVEQRAFEAERTREEEARRRVDEERLRIARELHDVVAHSLSIIAVQSGAATHVLDSDPAQARASLDAIRRTSKESLDELRAMLGVLRADGDTDAPLSPVPGLARIAELVEPLRAAGYEVDLAVEGSLADIPALVEVSAYRVVQEALTNVVRHAGECRVTVVVRREPDAIVVSVEDDGVGVSADSTSGHGLAGMHERVTALGGTFDAGPRPGGGFSVSARIPLVQRGSAS